MDDLLTSPVATPWDLGHPRSGWVTKRYEACDLDSAGVWGVAWVQVSWFMCTPAYDVRAFSYWFSRIWCTHNRFHCTALVGYVVRVSNHDSCRDELRVSNPVILHRDRHFSNSCYIEV